MSEITDLATVIRGQLDSKAEGELADLLRQVLVKLTITPKLKGEELADEEVSEAAFLYPPWEIGLTVTTGEVYQWDGTLVEVLQDHTTQGDWTPDLVPALFKIYRTPDMTEWIAGISVEVGEQLTYSGSTYSVLQAHTTQVGWEPPNVPSLWELVVSG